MCGNGLRSVFKKVGFFGIEGSNNFIYAYWVYNLSDFYNFEE